MKRSLVVALTLVVLGCAQIPPSAQETEAKKFEAVPGKAVIYVAQNPIGQYGAGLTFDDGTLITTWPGTFYRWVTAPGTRAIRSSEGNLNASIKLQTDPGKVYFVQHYVTGIRGSTTDARLERVSDRVGRQLVVGATLCCNPY